MGRFHRGNNYGESSDNSDGPEFGDGPEFQGWEERSSLNRNEEPVQSQLDMLREMVKLHLGPHWLDVLNKNIKD